MFRSVFLKTLYTKRWMTLWWTLSGLLLVLLTVSVFPAFQEALGQSLNDVPEALRSLVGDASSYATLPGYLDLQVFEQLVFLSIVLGIILGTSLLAGEENEGTLQTLASLPISRSRVYIQKLLALAVIVGVVTFSLFVGSLLGASLIGESLDFWRLAGATVGAWLLALTLSILAYALGAATGKRGVAGAAAGLVAFLAFLLPALTQGVEGLQFLEKLSPFYYFNSPLTTGLSATDYLTLIAVNITLTIVGYIFFSRRDIHQR